jgi:hypothetical protein
MTELKGAVLDDVREGIGRSLRLSTKNSLWMQRVGRRDVDERNDYTDSLQKGRIYPFTTRESRYFALEFKTNGLDTLGFK